MLRHPRGGGMRELVLRTNQRIDLLYVFPWHLRSTVCTSPLSPGYIGLENLSQHPRCLSTLFLNLTTSVQNCEKACSIQFSLAKIASIWHSRLSTDPVAEIASIWHSRLSTDPVAGVSPSSISMWLSCRCSSAVVAGCALRG